jgi:hypothetical protein
MRNGGVCGSRTNVLARALRLERRPVARSMLRHRHTDPPARVTASRDGGLLRAAGQAES